jgi:ribosomal protein L11 methyltransferase
MKERTQPRMDAYLNIRCRIPAAFEEELPGLIAPWPVLGVEICEQSEESVWASIYLPEAERDSADSLRRALAGSGAIDVTLTRRETEDWLERYRAHARPFVVGDRWWIDPHPDQPTPAPGDRSRLAIEPRTAFGSGSHESTQGVLRALEELEINGRSVLDVGTGSGILALAADSMGASWVVAFDNDPAAVWVARQSARQQDWRPRVRFLVGTMSCVGNTDFDVVLCNMIAAKCLPLIGDIRRLVKVGGAVVISGLLGSEVGIVSEELATAGLVVRSTRRLGEWASLTAIRERAS